MAHHYLKFPRRLIGMSGAVLLFAAANMAHADAFSNQSTKDVEQLKERLAAMEATLNSLKARSDASPAPGASTGAAEAPGQGEQPAVAKPPATAQELDILSEPPYSVLGKVNGLHLVKQGAKRLLLTDDELKQFEAHELAKALKRQELAAQAPSNGAALSKLPVPPPPVSNTVADQNKKFDTTSSASAAPATKASKYAAPEQGKPAAVNSTAAKK